MEVNHLNIDNILSDDEVADLLFSNEDNDASNDSSNKEEENNEEDNEESTAEIDPDTLFGDISESVGSEENNKENVEGTTSNESDASPDFFSSIASAFAEEGIFPDLDEETIKGIKTAEDFRNAVNSQIQAGLTEQQRRIAEAMNDGMEHNEIRQHEQLLSWLNAQDRDIEKEGDAGDDLRKRILLQDYINKGFKPEKAEHQVQKIFDEGTEIEEAKESLQNLKEFYNESYQKLRDAAKAEAEKEVEERKQKVLNIKSSIFNEKSNLFGDIEISKDVRQKAFDAISKPIYKDPNTGDFYTAMQKLELDNSEEFLAKLGLLYALTDGFTNINNIVKKQAKKEIKRGFAELERKINNTSRNGNGELNFSSGVSDTNSYIGKGIRLDL